VNRIATRVAPWVLMLMVCVVAMPASGCTDGSPAATSTTMPETTATTAATVPPTSPSTSTTTPAAATVVQLALPAPDPEALTLEAMAADSDLVLYGEILAELPGRWNGPNREQWTPERAGDSCIIYRSWLVQAMGAVAGFAPVGDVITVHTEGGTVPGSQPVAMTLERADPALRPGDHVLLFLTQDDLRYGGTYEPIGYWLHQGAAGAFVQGEGGDFLRPAEAAGGAEQSVDIDTVRAAAEAAAAAGDGREGGGTEGTWHRSDQSLEEVRQWLAERLPDDQAVILPAELPEDWAVATGEEPNPWIQPSGGGASPTTYRVTFTDGGRVAALTAYQVGDWGEMPFHWVLVDGRAVRVFVGREEVIATLPGVPSRVVVGEPGTRVAVLEIAGALSETE